MFIIGIKNALHRFDPHVVVMFSGIVESHRQIQLNVKELRILLFRQRTLIIFIIR